MTDENAGRPGTTLAGLPRQQLLRQRRAVLWHKVHVVRSFAFKLYVHAVFQTYDAFDSICRNQSSLEFVAG